MLSRRQFTASPGSAAAARAASPYRPIILWITCEDIGPALGCYGDTDADTPNLDRSDHRHRLVTSQVWMLPRLAHAGRLVRGAFGGWQFSGIVTVQSGDPLTVVAGYDHSLTGLNNDRANLVLGPSVYNSNVCGATLNCISWLNPGAFTGPKNAAGTFISDGTFGNVGKGALRGPGSFGSAVGLSKISRCERAGSCSSGVSSSMPSTTSIRITR